jgi:hypothetical protein
MIARPSESSTRLAIAKATPMKVARRCAMVSRALCARVDSELA